MMQRNGIGAVLFLSALVFGATGCGRDSYSDPQTGSETTGLTPVPIEICDNNLDDDNDSKIDCHDDDCHTFAGCSATECIDGVLGPVTGPRVAGDSTTGKIGTYTSSCGGGKSPEVSYQWTAPATGTYLIDTFGSSFDTILSVLDAACDGVEIACNDDTSLADSTTSSASSVRVDLQADQLVIIRVDGRVGGSGDFVVNITRQRGGGGESGGSPGSPGGSGGGGTSPGSGPDPVDARETGLCADGFDQDGDALIDCADPDCRNDAACPLLNCPSDDLGSSVAMQIAQGTAGVGEMQIKGSCGGDGHERTFAWTAPKSGSFTFDSNGSLAPVVLYVLDGSCTGAELGCAASSDRAAASVTVTLTEGARIIVAMDGPVNASGVFWLNVWEGSRAEVCDDNIDNDGDHLVDCADSDCRTPGQCMNNTCPNGDLADHVGNGVVDGTTEGGNTERRGTCGGRMGPERSYAWRAPSTGSFAVSVTGSFLDGHVVYVLRDSCTGQEAACVDLYDDSHAVAVINAVQGDNFVIVVDTSDSSWSEDGEPFTLNIQPTEASQCGDGIDNDGDGQVDCADTDCIAVLGCRPECPEIDLGSAVGVAVGTGTTTHYLNEHSGSCGGWSGPERTFVWSAPAAGSYRIDTAGSSFNPILYALEPTCDDLDELACNTGSSLQSVPSAIQLTLTEGQSIVLVVDGAIDTDGPFKINISRSEVGACADNVDQDGDGLIDCADSDCTPDPACCVTTNLASAVGPAVFSGSSSGWSNLRQGTCGGGGRGGEKIFMWTAPTAGTYLIDSFGTSFDTVLYARDGSCGGAQIACNDDTTGGLSGNSRITVTVGAMQTIAIVADTYSATTTGTYVLNITPKAMPTETNTCSDGRDVDQDGLTDCADPDCATDAACHNGQCAAGAVAANVGAIDLGSRVGVPAVTGDTTTGTNRLSSTCGGAQAPEVVYQFTAPAVGLYTFDTLVSALPVQPPLPAPLPPADTANGEDNRGDGDGDPTPTPPPPAAPLNTVVYLLDATCSPNGLICDDDEDGTYQSSVSTTLGAGQMVYVVVDGSGTQAGPFALNITQDALQTETAFCADRIDNDGDGRVDCADPDCALTLACPPPACAEKNAGARVGYAVAYGSTIGTGTDFDDDGAGLCGGAASIDVSYAWMAPQDGLYTFDTFGSNFDTVLYLQTNQCRNDTTLECDDNEAHSRQSRVVQRLQAGQRVVIVIDGTGGSKGTYVLNIARSP